MPEETPRRLWRFDHVEAIAQLSKTDKRFARLIGKLVAKSIEFKLNIDELESPYDALLEAIVHQSISGKAAKTIFARVRAFGTGDRPPTPHEILKVSPQALREAGLSFAKAAAVHDLAQKTIDGVVPTLEEAHKLSDEELVTRLVSVRGIGAWTVEMFLIFRLGRPDVLPIHDLGVQKGFAVTYGKKTMPKPKELLAFGERWRPYRTVASWYMWRAADNAPKSARLIKKMTKKMTKVKIRVKVKRVAPKKRVTIAGKTRKKKKR
jgi:DNA-3-methyladenine glycosylase II